ncbi:MAG: hypothetical protein IJ899_03245 [Blautia sp.]|nr:hypothetical protein [Blautia sp.]
MGPDDSLLRNGMIMYYSENGVHFEPFPKPSIDYTIPELDSNYFDEFCTIGFDLAKESDMTICGYIMLPNKKMSRKTFKKWLMSRGFNRDLAEWFCKAVKSFHGKKSYLSLYLHGQFASTPQTLFNDLFDALFPIPDSPYTKYKENKE